MVFNELFHFFCVFDRFRLFTVPSDRSRLLVKEMMEALRSEEGAEDWVMRNDALFLMALTSELTRLETIIRDALPEFKYVHVDLEPW